MVFLKYDSNTTTSLFSISGVGKIMLIVSFCVYWYMKLTSYSYTKSINGIHETEAEQTYTFEEHFPDKYNIYILF